MDKHTPTPWSNENDDPNIYHVFSPDQTPSKIGRMNDQADAAFIVRAVNCHEGLLYLLCAAAEVLKAQGFRGMADECFKMISVAEGK